MKTFHCTYEQMMNEPYEVVKNNMMILSLEADEQDRQDRLSKLKNKLHK
jgi:hypothetical protein